MNLQPLFETQAILDERIKDKHNLHDKDLLDKKILALQVELGELANEWRGFKFWSEDQEPNEYIDCDVCADQPGQYEVFIGDEVVGFPCPKCEGHAEVYVGDRLLEEYVDCLHFILSIGNDLNFKEYLTIKNFPTPKEHEHIYLMTFEAASNLYYSIHSFKRYEGQIELRYRALFECLIALGLMMGFTWEQIEQAYFAKNKVNHERQEQGY